MCMPRAKFHLVLCFKSQAQSWQGCFKGEKTEAQGGGVACSWWRVFRGQASMWELKLGRSAWEG